MPVLSAFDLDGTLITGNGSLHFGRYLYRQGLLSKMCMMRLVWTYVRHRYFNLDVALLHKLAYHFFFAGRLRTDLDALVTQFLDVALPNLWYQPALQQMSRARELGHQIAILSSSPDFLVTAFAKRLNVDICRSSIYPVDAEGKFAQVPQILNGDAKAELLLELASSYQIEPAQIIAYSDSILDLPFLQMAGRAVAVKPDRALRKLCVQRAWEIV